MNERNTMNQSQNEGNGSRSLEKTRRGVFSEITRLFDRSAIDDNGASASSIDLLKDMGGEDNRLSLPHTADE